MNYYILFHLCCYINEFIYSFVACIKTTSHSLLLITDGTDDCISAIDNSASRELQLSIINSKFPCKNLFHRKCVFLLHDQFDGRKKQKCACYFHAFSLFIFYIHFQMMFFFMHHVGDAWNIWMDCLELWVQITILWKWGWGPSTFSKVSSVCKCLPCDFYQKRTSELSQMWLSSLREMWYSMFTHSEDHRRNWSHNDKNTTLEA